MTPKQLKVTTRAGESFDVEVVPCSFAALFEACAVRTPATLLAERSVRLLDNHNRFERLAPPGWLDTLDDDSTRDVILASNELNITPDRAGKVAALAANWVDLQRPSTTSSSSDSGTRTSSE